MPLLLDVKDLSAGYARGTPTIHGIGLHVAAHEVVTIIGANGSGKTTFLKAIMGLLPWCEGRVEFDARDISTMGTGRRVHLGMVMAPQGRAAFGPLTVEENLILGAYPRMNPLWRSKTALGRLDYVLELFPILRKRWRVRSSLLSGGEQVMLVIGRALMSEPRLILLDEPSLGLAPVVIDQLGEALRQLAASGVGMLLVEQNAQLGLAVAARGYVLHGGEVVSEGTSADLLSGDLVAAQYVWGARREGAPPSPLAP